MSREPRVLRIPLDTGLTDAEKAVLQALSARFPRQDLDLDAEDGLVTVHLRALDVRQFRAALTSLLREHGLEPSAHRLLRIADEIEAIGSYGIKGGKRVFVGFADERKVQHRRRKERKRGICYYARSTQFATQPNPLPQEFANQIICGDAEQVLALLPDNCVDLIFTSPPYNFGLEYQGSDDAARWESYFAKLFAIFEQCIRVAKFDGRIVVNVQPLFSDYIPTHHIVSNFFMQRGLIWKGEILWEKSNYNCKYTAWGSWKSPASPYLKYTWEFLEVFVKGSLRKRGRAQDADITADEFKQWVLARWNIAPQANMSEWGHPAMFPEELARRVIRLFSFRGDVVLDPFNGVGTTTAVAAALGRQFVGIDICADYCDKARRRLAGVHPLCPSQHPSEGLALQGTCPGN